MRNIFIALMLGWSAAAMAQSNIEFEKANEKSTSDSIDMENGVIGIADNRGFTLKSKNDNFVFKPQ